MNAAATDIHDSTPAETQAHLRCWKRVAEASFVARLRAGDAAAFNELVDRHRARMMVTATRILRSEHDAEDAVQQAFCSACRAIHKFDGNCQLSTWLHRIVTNECLTQLRTRRRRPTCSLNDLDADFTRDCRRPSATPDIADESQDETNSAVLRLVNQLPSRYREVVKARIMNGNDTMSSSRLLKTSESVIKTRLYRARRMLRSLLD